MAFANYDLSILRDDSTHFECIGHEWNLFNIEPFFVFFTESVMLGPRFIPDSVFYTQSIMLSPRFIPESVFYTQSVMLSPRFIPESVFYTQSVIRSPQSVY